MMSAKLLEYLALSKIVEASITLAKDLLKDKIQERNKKALEEKEKKIQREEKFQKKRNVEIVLKESETAVGEITTLSAETNEFLQAHLRGVKQWASAVSFSDLRGAKSINDIYIHLDTYLTPLRLHVNVNEKDCTVPLEEALFSWARHCVILGQPGAGKTTSMKKLCLALLDGQGLLPAFPLLVRFRDLTASTSGRGVILDALQKYFH